MIKKKISLAIIVFILGIFVFAQDPLILGNPSNATSDIKNNVNYLIIHDTFDISYNNESLIPNWVAWHLELKDLGDGRYTGIFYSDNKLPKEWYHVINSDYTDSNFDRGHMCPNADRNAYNYGKETFVTTNIIPQTSDSNKIIWKELEDYERQLCKNGNECYIFAGGYGKGGTDLNGTRKETISSHNIIVPKYTWKIIIILIDGDNDLNRIDKNTEAIAVWIPNIKGCALKSLNDYSVTIDYIQNKTGYDFLSKVPVLIQNEIENKKFIFTK